MNRASTKWRRGYRSHDAGSEYSGLSHGDHDRLETSKRASSLKSRFTGRFKTAAFSRDRVVRISSSTLSILFSSAAIKKLGFSSTLAAVSVEPELVDRAAKTIGQFHEVTHNYLRHDAFNIWFTLIAADEERIVSVLEEIRTTLSLERAAVLNLPVKRLFKLDARFDVSK